MIRLTKWFAVAGAIVPVLLLIIGAVELYLDIKKIPLTTIYGFYLWPSRIILLGQDENLSLSGLLGLSISIFVNVLLYAVVGLLIGSLRKLLSLLKYMARSAKSKRPV